MIEPGTYPDLSNEAYHADSAISRSGIMEFIESPFKYWANYINPGRPPKKQTDEMIFGSAFHTFILEPHLFYDHYAVEPERVLLKDVGRKLYDEYKKSCEELENSKRIILSNDDLIVLNNMKIALDKSPVARELISDGVYEKSFFWKDTESELMIKARPDILHRTMIGDIKTCASASSRAYIRAMVDGGYHIQGAMIRDAVRKLEGKEVNNVINICIEKKYPYAIGIKIISERALDEGERRYKRVLLDMKECFETNEWPSYEIENVELPTWAI